VEKCCGAAGCSNSEKILLGRSVEEEEEEDRCIFCGCDTGKGNPDKLPPAEDAD